MSIFAVGLRDADCVPRGCNESGSSNRRVIRYDVGICGGTKQVFDRVVGILRKTRCLQKIQSRRMLSRGRVSRQHGKLTKLYASDPNKRSPFFHATEDCIFLFESLFRTTSNGTPGFINDAFIQSEP